MKPMTDDPIFCRAMLFGLLKGCPLEDELSECQLKDIRQLGNTEQMAWINKLSDEHCVSMFQRHLECMQLLSSS